MYLTEPLPHQKRRHCYQKRIFKFGHPPTPRTLCTLNVYPLALSGNAGYSRTKMLWLPHFPAQILTFSPQQQTEGLSGTHSLCQVQLSPMYVHQQTNILLYIITIYHLNEGVCTSQTHW